MKVQEQCRWARRGARRRQNRYASDRVTVARQRPHGNGADDLGADARRFVDSWAETCDLFLSAGFISPARFAEVVRELRLATADMPDDLRRRLFVLVGVAADVGLDDLQSKTEDILCAFAPDESDDVRRISYSAGTDVNIHTYAKWVSEHAARALVFRSARNALTDPRPIGEIVAELLQEVSSVG